MIRAVYVDDRLIEMWDYSTRMVTRYDSEGVPVTVPFSPAETAAADADAAATAAAQTRAASRALVKAIVADLKLEKDRVDPIIAKANNLITGGDTKDVARAAKRIADAAIELARFVQDIA